MTAKDDIRNYLLEQQNRLSSKLDRSIVKLIGRFEKFVNPLDRFADSINRLDKTNIAALKIGITNDKLSKSVDKNSNILKQNLTSNQKLQEAIIDGFGQGVRTQTTSLDSLTTEMVATGQDVKSLNRLNSDLILFTGNNVAAVDKMAKVNKEVSDSYGVSNEKLINTLNSLKDTMEQASFFGSDAVESIGTVSKQLVGRAGGTDITGALSTLNKILVGGLDTERTAQMLGATGARQTLASGGKLNLQQILPILAQLESRRNQLGGGRFGLDILSQSLGISKSQTAQLLNLSEIAKQDFKVQDELKKTNDETFNSIENINSRALNFYDKTAVAMLGTLGSMNTNVLFLGTTMTQLLGGLASVTGGAGGIAGLPPGGIGPPLPPGTGGRQSKMHNFFARSGFSKIPGFSLEAIRRAGGGRGLLKRGVGGAGLAMSMLPMLEGGLESAGLGDALGATAKGSAYGASLGSFIPGVGTLAGGLAGGIVGIAIDGFQAMVGSSEAEKEQLELMKEEKQRERAEEASRDMSRLDFLAGYIRQRGGSFMTDPEMKAIFEDIKTAVEKAAKVRTNNGTLTK